MSKYTRGKWIRNVADILCCEDEDEKKANERLIAAAPEMYEQLYEALQLCEGKSSYDGDEFCEQAKNIRELLERIDGEECEECQRS